MAKKRRAECTSLISNEHPSKKSLKEEVRGEQSVDLQSVWESLGEYLSGTLGQARILRALENDGRSSDFPVSKMTLFSLTWPRFLRCSFCVLMSSLRWLLQIRYYIQTIISYFLSREVLANGFQIPMHDSIESIKLLHDWILRKPE